MLKPFIEYFSSQSRSRSRARVGPAPRRNTVVDGSRKVVLTRSVGGAASDDHRFDATANELTYINAVGGSAQFEFHKARA